MNKEGIIARSKGRHSRKTDAKREMKVDGRRTKAKWFSGRSKKGEAKNRTTHLNRDSCVIPRFLLTTLQNV